MADRFSLSAGGVQVVFDASEGRLPAVLHWGADLGPLDDTSFDALALAQSQTSVVNGPDIPTRLSLVPEGWAGWVGHPGLSGSRLGRDWSPRFTVTSIDVDGDADLRGSVANLGAAGLVFHAADDETRLGLDLVVEMLEAGLLRVRAIVTNLASDPYQVDQLLVALPVPSRAREVLDFSGRWAKERVPQRTVLGVGTHWREARHGRTGPDSAYVLHLGTPGFGFTDGEIWATHTAWSGNHVHYAERVLTSDQVLGGGELLLPGEVVLGEQESYGSPWVYANYATGLDGIARRFHSFLRSRPQHPDAERPVTLNVWEAVYFDHRLDRLVDLAERAASVGVERFVLDDGWFGSRRDDHAGLGDWVVSADVWPDGLHPLVNRVKDLGMQFGLWFEPEMVNPDSDLARAHPEWIMQVPGRLPVESRFQQVLNLGILGAYAHVRDQMMALLDEYAIDYIKWDHNRDLIEAGTTPHGVPGVHEQTLAFYRLLDELKAAHAGLEIESCSSGGSRIDLEVLQRTDRVWVSDNIDPADRLQMNRWTTQLIPPEMMGSHIASGASHVTGRFHSLAFRAGVAVFGHLGIEWDLAQASPEELSQVTAWVTWYKQRRGVLNAGRLVRVDLPEAGVDVHGVVTDELAIYSLSVMENPATGGLGMLALPGLEPEATYRVRAVELSTSGVAFPTPWMEGAELTGRTLGHAGIRVPVVRPDQALLIEVARV